MERDERNRADDLDRYWDALLLSEATSVKTDLDADLATLVTRLRAAGTPSRPSSQTPTRPGGNCDRI